MIVRVQLLRIFTIERNIELRGCVVTNISLASYLICVVMNQVPARTNEFKFRFQRLAQCKMTALKWNGI